ncbi:MULTISPECIES: sensor histidine kinase [Methylosinus]|uniref:histidine kinase n=1 Tax=Methylosinus trichosporium (strain ATCC 35070 / NCIMB 11131 / UNIQEM 75 / OB3b) TaxID=595536 RepID=A0A2D2D0G1_METT3|nr:MULTISPECIES: ATP-binding protein [Methylosinus]ATQ68491.1 histidine kinase [Methylosinus trichosporium OB3b]OBS53976.1 histidine kinase [Methylosinus sp. 3S-1]
MGVILTAAWRSRAWPLWTRYAGATALSLLGFFVQLALRQEIPPHFFLLSLPATLFSAVLFGGNPATWSIALSAGSTGYFLLEPQGFAIGDRIDAMALVLFIATALLLVFVVDELFQELRRTGHAAATARDELGRLGEAGRLKDLLLQEMSHRTKNDLQFLSSMLQIEGRALEEGRGRASLLAAASRMTVVGRVHSLLQHSGSDRVEMQPLFDELCADLRISLIGLRPIALRAEVTTGLLPLDAARSIALIVNELVTNALKHAFPEDRSGTVTVRLTREAGALRLLVMDDGVGHPAATTSPGTGFGQKLVRSLAQQLGGALTIEAGSAGTRCELRFPSPT